MCKAVICCLAWVVGVSACVLGAELDAPPIAVVAPDPRPLVGRHGEGQFEIGMSVADVRRLHPELKALARPLAVAAPALPSVARYVLSKQRVSEHTKESDIELRFWNDKLWAVIVYFPAEEADAVGTALRARYGPPASGNRMSSIWRRAGITLVLAPTQRWYGFTDDELNDAVASETAAEVERALARGREAAMKTTASNVGPVPTPSGANAIDGGAR